MSIVENIDKVRFLVQKLSEVQELYYDALLDEINLPEELEDFLYDYIFNASNEENFENYLRKYDKSLTPIGNE